jgi:hypothetical protein
VTEARPWRRALAWLAFLGPFFFASYGFANWLASRRAGVGSIVYAWERAIPFLPWTIIPYWSIDVLYAVSLFVCTTRRELDRHAQRLLLVQIVAVSIFIAFPLRFSFDRPEADGLFGALFAALGAFDRPFNQAPSLHIALLVVIWVRFAHHVNRRAHWLLHLWMALIGVSVLTTYQHHFIDLPTGLALGFLALWLLPDDHPSPLTTWSLTRDRRRSRMALLYGTGAALAATVASLGGAWLWLWWLAIALAVVTLNYAAIGSHGFQKGRNGQLSVGARGLLAPYLVLARVNAHLWTRGRGGTDEVADGVFIGPVSAAGRFPAVVDLSAEVACNSADCTYRALPVLDLTVPDVQDLREAAAAIEEARERGPVVVCCAIGYSRSACAAAAWLLVTQRAGGVEEAIAIVRRARPFIVLTKEHHEVLGQLADRYHRLS